jgi:hypothetical protein
MPDFHLFFNLFPTLKQPYQNEAIALTIGKRNNAQ